MKARHAYLLLFFVPSVMLAALTAALGAAAVAGLLWLFVYGDDPWPARANTVAMSVASLAGLVVLATLLLLARHVGKRQEGGEGLRRAHVLVALGLSVGLPLLVLFQQWQVGNLGGV